MGFKENECNGSEVFLADVSLAWEEDSYTGSETGLVQPNILCDYDSKPPNSGLELLGFTKSN